MFKTFPLFLLLLVSSCSLKKITPDDESVRLYYDKEKISNCTFINEVIGSQGHWYDYLLISNKDLTQGAINDLKSQARAIGANSVHIHRNIDFQTSVTILGQAYQCP